MILFRTSDGEDDDGSESPLEEASKEPEIIMPLRNKVVLVGGELKLACRIYCPGKMDVEWMKDGKPIQESDRISYVVEDELHTLCVSELQLADSGLYKAVFKNKYGTVQTKSDLTVEGLCDVIFFSAFMEFRLLILVINTFTWSFSKLSSAESGG